jgi:hypothetical protein
MVALGCKVPGPEEKSPGLTEWNLEARPLPQCDYSAHFCSVLCARPQRRQGMIANEDRDYAVHSSSTCHGGRGCPR